MEKSPPPNFHAAAPANIPLNGPFIMSYLSLFDNLEIFCTKLIQNFSGKKFKASNVPRKKREK